MRNEQKFILYSSPSRLENLKHNCCVTDRRYPEGERPSGGWPGHASASSHAEATATAFEERFWFPALGFTIPERHVEVREKSQVTFFRSFLSSVWDSVSHEPGTSPSSRESLGQHAYSDFLVSSSLLAVARLTDVSHNIWLFTWVLGIWTQVLKPDSKHVSNRVLSPSCS